MNKLDKIIKDKEILELYKNDVLKTIRSEHKIIKI